jgi:hypothetical protein
MGSVVYLEIFGEKKSRHAWSQDERCPVSGPTFSERLAAGWDPERALTEPAANVPLYAFNLDGVEITGTLKELHKRFDCSVSQGALYHRLASGMAPERAFSQPLLKESKENHQLEFEYQGRSWTVPELFKLPECKAKNIKTLRSRLVGGTTVEDAPTERGSVHLVEAFGESKTVNGWSKDSRCSVNRRTLQKRLDKDIYPEDALGRTSEIKSSFAEQQLFKFVDSRLPAHSNTRKIIPPQELDIYIPDLNFAIEFNGLYWHREDIVGKRYHLDKYLKCQEQGVRLLQIWEDDYINNRELIHKMIERKLGVSTEERIFARKNKVVQVSGEDVFSFMQENHIQGLHAGSIHLGLVGGVGLVAVMTLTDCSGEWTLDRFATSCLVPGGFTKLLKFFKENFDWKSIKTFSDNCVSDGGLYEKSGFTRDKDLPPDYKYLVGGNRREHKFRYRLKRFKSDPDLIYVKGATEAELAHLNRLSRIYDAGKVRWKMINSC